MKISLFLYVFRTNTDYLNRRNSTQRYLRKQRNGEELAVITNNREDNTLLNALHLNKLSRGRKEQGYFRQGQ